MKIKKLLVENLSRVNKNSICAFIVQAVGSLATIAFNIYLANLLSVAEFGLFAFFVSIVSIASILPMSGLPHLIQSKVPKLRDEPLEIANLIWWCNYRIIKISALVILIMSIARISGYLDQFSEVAFLCILPLILFRSYQAQLASMINSVFKHCESIFILNTLAPVLLLLLTFLCTFIRPVGIDNMYLIYLVVFTLVVFCGIYFANEVSILGVKSKKHYVIKNFSFIVILQSLSLQLPIILLNQFGTPEIAGNYRVVIMIATMPLLLVSVVNTIYLPLFSRLFEQGLDREGKEQLYKATVKLVIFLAPFYVILHQYQNDIISLLFGSEYRMVGAMMNYCIVGSMFSTYLGLFPGYLNMTDREGVTLIASMLSIILGCGAFALISVYDLKLAGPIYFVVSSVTFYAIVMLRSISD